ncbi:MAG TPA: porin, partial [Cyanobacteria bacterium UBA12227]|nr:porin [Cyanobacteria bacterium UBA12227]
MTKATQTKQFTLAALSAVLLSAIAAGAVFAQTPCTTPTPDCP